MTIQEMYTLLADVMKCGNPAVQELARIVEALVGREAARVRLVERAYKKQAKNGN